MAKAAEEKQYEAIFEFKLTLNQKIDQVVNSEDPVIFELCKGLDL